MLTGRRLKLAVASVVLVVAVFATYHPVLGFELLGIDTYPIVLTSAVESPGDLVTLLTQPMMGGRFWADFYRPVSGLVIAFDHAVWGLDPFGYQLTTLVLFALTAIALYAWVERLCGPASRVAAPLAAGLFVLFPTHYEVLPVAARRPEILASLLSLLSLLVLLRPRSLERAGLPWGAGALALLAIGAKETALLLPLFAFVSVLLYSPRPELGARVRQATLSSVPFAVALGIAVGLRFVALGSLGGHGDSNASVIYLPRALEMGMALVHPQQAQLPSWAAGWLELLLLGLLAGTAALGLPRLASLAPPTADGPTRVRAASLAGLWTLTMLLLHAYTGKWNSWYLFFPAIGWCWLCGVALDGLASRALAAGRRPLRVAAGASAVTLAGLVAWQLGYSPLLYRYPEWAAASDAQGRYLMHTARLIEGARPGSVLEPGPFPQRAAARLEPGRAHIRGAAILYVHSIQAWAELRYPDLPVRIALIETPGQPLSPALRDWAMRQGALRPPEPDEIVVRLPHAGVMVASP